MKSFRVFIASPGDVAAERKAVEEVAQELNDTLGRLPEKEFSILTIDWKKHTGPNINEFGSQGHIDKKLRPKDCDAMVIILWSRIGEPILYGNETGTEHEISAAFESWKVSLEPKRPQIFTYFKSAAIKGKNLKADQIRGLEDFKAKFQPGGRYEQATYSTFTRTEAFKEMLRRDLTDLVLNDLPDNKIASSQESVLAEIQPGSHQIAVCHIEVLFGSPAAPGLIDCVMSGLEYAITKALETIDGLLKNKNTSDLSSTKTISTVEFLRFAAPASISQAAQGVMLIWELPPGRLEAGVAMVVLDFVNLVQSYFKRKLDEISYTYPGQADMCKLRTVLSSGEAVKRQSKIDKRYIYIGEPIDEVYESTRNLSLGLTVSNIRFAPYLFMERLCAGEGNVVFLDKGCCTIWSSNEPLRPRYPKAEPLDSLVKVLEWSDNVRAKRLKGAEPLPPFLTMDDLFSIFEIRARWEARFAQELAIRVEKDEAGASLLDPIMRTINAMSTLYQSKPNAVGTDEWLFHGAKFHSQIAEASHPTDGAIRRRFTEWVYAFTKPVYAFGMIDIENDPQAEGRVVIEEHLHILELIKQGESDDVQAIVNDHLKQHYNRAHNALVKYVRRVF